MKFYEIEFLNIPKIIFALNAEVENYQNSFINRENYLEISLIESGIICKKDENGGEQKIYPNFVLPILQDTNCFTYAADNEPQKHSTTAVSVKYISKFHNNISKDEVNNLINKIKSNSSIVLIPFQENLTKSFPYFLRAMQKIIYFNSSTLAGEKICAVSAFFELCGKFTTFTLNELNNPNSEISPIADYTKQYIHMKYKEKIYISNIAADLNISVGYLQSIFKSGTGMTIIEYYNRYRINIALQYIDHYGFSLKKAAESIGIDDEYYMSKLFKRVTGISYKEYIKYNKGKLP